LFSVLLSAYFFLHSSFSNPPPPTTVTCLLGSNGAGKTTMMRILCGLDSQYQGQITLQEVLKEGTGCEGETGSWAGAEGGAESESESEADAEDGDYDEEGALSFIASLCSAAFWMDLCRGLLATGGVIAHPPLHSARGRVRVRRCVGWCSQEDAVFDYLTVREHMELFEALLGQADSGANAATVDPTVGASAVTAGAATTAHTSAANTLSPTADAHLLLPSLSADAAARGVDEALRRLGMTEHAHKMACALSGGMRRRLTLGLAFAGTVGDSRVSRWQQPQQLLNIRMFSPSYLFVCLSVC
jgi:ABC-type Na+ transport system ATPase subunit NatA